MNTSIKIAFIKNIFLFDIFIGLIFNCKVSLAIEETEYSSISTEKFDDTCLTKSCNQTASAILNNMDTTINPCDNFYKFACGGFINSYNQTKTDEIISASKLIEERIINDLTLSIEKKYSPNSQKLFNLLTILYNICLNEFTKVITKRQKCINKLQLKLPTAMSALYIQNYGKNSVKKKVYKMAINIRNEFLKNIKNNHWIDEKSKHKISLKFKNIYNNIAYPNEIVDADKLNDYYEKIYNINKQYIDDIFETQTFITNPNYIKLIEPEYSYNQNFIANLTKVSGWYSFFHNSINIPVGILQGIYYDKNRPNYMNYGGAGNIIGHELTHGLDNLKYEIEKNETSSNYSKKVECFIKQYENYSLNDAGNKIDGILTSQENIADNGGMKAAYFAYKKFIKERKKKKRELKLPGLENYTSKQMFWISAANSRCSKYPLYYLDYKIQSHQHTSSEFRILGTLSNIIEFSNDFNCPVGSIMNPKTKCSLW
ncbi:hypothetical protein HCN44_003629 [Aphidius gifuensis]|uniref:Zincin n=1 Tax=Aphidius gifuensis TaxID=684658 RepID=A0A834XN41_APHGI|nr:neprilysin-2-like [Aphidius gifuensis]KAF7987766.1 hypothetical protein HCN44_003629 [Aphidius gifuensis]